MSNNKQQTPVEWQHIELSKFLNGKSEFTHKSDILIKAKEMEKEQSIGLIKQTAMFMAASHLDEEIANMSYEDVYKTYYNETYGNNHIGDVNKMVGGE